MSHANNNKSIRSQFNMLVLTATVLSQPLSSVSHCPQSASILSQPVSSVSQCPQSATVLSQPVSSVSQCVWSASIKISNRVGVCCSMRWCRRHWSRAELSYLHAIAKSPMASKLFIVFFQRKNTINQRNHKLSSAWAMEFTPRHG